MAKKNSESEPLSKFQDTSKTGRTDESEGFSLSVNGNKVSAKALAKLASFADRTKESADDEPTGRPYRITEANLKEGLCKYAYEITRGTGVGDTHSVKGSGFYEDDMMNAFSQFRPHLAFIDDVFKRAGIEVEDIDMLHDHEFTQLYTCTGIKVKGGKDDEAIVLIGNKYLSSGGRMEIETPKIPIDNHSSYKWYNELKAAADKAREEVALYKEGKCHVPETEEEEPKLKQNKLPFGEGDAKDGVTESDFAEAAL